MTWMKEESLTDAPHWRQYIVAIYFAIMTLTTVGYGDVNPTNDEEYIVVVSVTTLISHQHAFSFLFFSFLPFFPHPNFTLTFSLTLTVTLTLDIYDVSWRSALGVYHRWPLWSGRVS